LSSTIAYTCLLGLFMPLVLLYYNRGYLNANRYLAGFMFFASLYVLESFYFFYGESLVMVIIFTMVHSFFYLIGPFAFFYLRSILKDNSHLSRADYWHFALFAISFIGYVPYFFSSWDFKVLVGQNIQSENWDMAAFFINKIIPHKIDQGLNVLHTYFYAISLWYLLWHHKKVANNPIVTTTQYRLIRNWLFIFTGLVTIITINFTIAMANLWLYDDKSIFLNRASLALLFASVIYIGMNMTVMLFPNIMYGLPIGNQYQPVKDSFQSNTNTIPKTIPIEKQRLDASIASTPEKKKELQLFSPEYIEKIEAMLQDSIVLQVYLQADFSLTQISDEIGIPAHHLTYYFNSVKKESFSDWRNQLRVEYALGFLKQGISNQLTLEGIGLNAGFKSYSTFIRSFKKVTKKTPSDYLESISQNWAIAKSH
jgi:AraC-like DNA-binding protein